MILNWKLDFSAKESCSEKFKYLEHTHTHRTLHGEKIEVSYNFTAVNSLHI